MACASLVAGAIATPIENMKTRMHAQQTVDKSLNKLRYVTWPGGYWKAVHLEGYQFMFTSYYTVVARLFLYGMINVSITNTITNGLKRRAGLPEEKL